MSLPEREMYENELKKVNKMKEIQLQVLVFIRKKKKILLNFFSVKQVQRKVRVLLKVERLHQLNVKVIELINYSFIDFCFLSSSK